MELHGYGGTVTVGGVTLPVISYVISTPEATQPAPNPEKRISVDSAAPPPVFQWVGRFNYHWHDPRPYRLTLRRGVIHRHRNRRGAMQGIPDWYGVSRLERFRGIWMFCQRFNLPFPIIGIDLI